MWQYELNDSAENWNYQKFSGYSGRYSFHQDRRSLTMYRYSRKLVERAVMQRFFILFLSFSVGRPLLDVRLISVVKLYRVLITCRMTSSTSRLAQNSSCPKKQRLSKPTKTKTVEMLRRTVIPVGRSSNFDRFDGHGFQFRWHATGMTSPFQSAWGVLQIPLTTRSSRGVQRF